MYKLLTGFQKKEKVVKSVGIKLKGIEKFNFPLVNENTGRLVFFGLQ